MSATFRVTVPFEPFVHESLDSRSHAELPSSDLHDGLTIRKVGDEYLADLRIAAPDPASAKTAGVERVEALLKILAAWNDSFTVRLAGVRAELEEAPVEIPTVEQPPDALAVHATGTVYVQGYVGVVKTKGSLAAEDAVLQRLDALAPYLGTALDINYLLVISDRRPVRFLLSATGLEALAVGRLGSQPTLAGAIPSGSKPALRSEVDTALERAGVGDPAKRTRGVGRLLGTMLEPVPVHVRKYLDLLAVTDASVDDVARWWRVRGEVAHGSGAEIDASDFGSPYELLPDRPPPGCRH